MTDNMPKVLKIFSLQSKVAIVTGGSRGIGAAIATGLAEAGATVYRLGRSDEPEKSDQENMIYKKCDITDVDKVNQLVEKIHSDHGKVDILVNCAGISMSYESDALEAERFAQTLKVNLESVYAMSLSVLNYMKKQPGGSIINITSINSKMGFPSNPGYVASKGGLASLTRALAVDYGKYNIRVNAVAPGYIHTAMTNVSYNDPNMHDQRLSHMVLKRWGNVADLVGACIFLSSDAGGYITGQELFVDGGWTIKGM